MKKLLLIICTLFISVQITNAQSLRDFFSKKNVSRVASTMGIDTPLKIEGTWKYTGTAIDLKTDNALKKAAAEVAAAAAEEKVNQQLATFGVNLKTIRFTFKKEGNLIIHAKNQKIPAQYKMSEDNKEMTLIISKIFVFKADVKGGLNSMSLLTEADKLIELINYLSEQTQSSSLQAINALAKNYDGIKIGIQLEKTK